ncbi:MAG: DUF2905 domain-containing protein [Syntrophorhabdales bacterium]|jgi:hypothetical protein
MAALGRMLIVLGIIILAVGLILLFVPRIPHIGRLPGDIYVKKDSFTFYFPLTTCVIISLILTLIFWIFRR